MRAPCIFRETCDILCTYKRFILILIWKVLETYNRIMIMLIVNIITRWENTEYKELPPNCILEYSMDWMSWKVVCCSHVEANNFTDYISILYTNDLFCNIMPNLNLSTLASKDRLFHLCSARADERVANIRYEIFLQAKEICWPESDGLSLQNNVFYTFCLKRIVL